MIELLLILAASSEIQTCPVQIADSQIVSNSDKQWNIQIPNKPRRLEKVVLYSGEPSKRRSLKGIRNASGITEWGFAGEDIWVECKYENSAAILGKNLGKISSCVFLPRMGGTKDPAKLLCK